MNGLALKEGNKRHAAEASASARGSGSARMGIFIPQKSSASSWMASSIQVVLQSVHAVFRSAQVQTKGKGLVGEAADGRRR
jgi:hypothetical protein